MNYLSFSELLSLISTSSMRNESSMLASYSNEVL